MMNSRTSEFKIAGIAAGITCLLFSSGFLVIFTPFPLYFVMTIYGRRIGKLSVIFVFAAAIVLYLFMLPVLNGLGGSWSLEKLVYLLPGAGLAKDFSLGSAQYFGLAYLSYFLIFGYLLGEGMIRRWPIRRWFAVSVGGTFIFLLIGVLLLNSMGYGVLDGAREYMTSMLNELIAAQESAGVNSERVFAIKQDAEHIVSFSLSIIPSVVFIMGLLIAAVNYLLSRWMIKAPGVFAHLGETQRFSAPPYLVWITITLGFLFFLDSYVIHAGLLRFVSINGLIAVSGIYFLQGMAIISFYLRNVRTRLFRIIIYIVMLMFFQIVAPIVVILGFTDLWIDFRRFMRKEELNNKRSMPWK